MSFEATAAALVADVDTFADFASPVVKPPFPANDPADPEAGWARRNPEQALLFLFVSPRDCGALDELMAL
ncbi:MAG: hypothetical protein M3Q08_17080 [Pseudomonadota bacterium]|jgi:hypothetical protein|nr:hypothetical protein [Pseudomonadota bacterium]